MTFNKLRDLIDEASVKHNELELQVAQAEFDAAKYKAQLERLQSMANLIEGGYDEYMTPSHLVLECLRIKL